MRYYETLFKTKHERTCGNHRAKVEYIGKQKYCIRFYYHGTLICQAFPMDKTFYLSDGGWNTISTHKVIMNYHRFLRSKKYRLAGIKLSGLYGMPPNFIGQ